MILVNLLRRAPAPADHQPPWYPLPEEWRPPLLSNQSIYMSKGVCGSRIYRKSAIYTADLSLRKGREG